VGIGSGWKIRKWRENLSLFNFDFLLETNRIYLNVYTILSLECGEWTFKIDSALRTI